ncbi:tetratricopeptide repeat protein [Amaricoccus macauensis]|uniref:tetratricopeptide repeat protein n=1 Tax=Amaricoccus macauensis TaxID=57001 RepID=UPI003C79E3D5
MVERFQLLFPGAGRLALALTLAAGVSLPALAQDQSVADVRADLDVLNGQVQQLREELVRQAGAQGLPQTPGTAFERLDQLETRLRELTGRVDVLGNDIERIVADASNRVDDIEFRLIELEGGDPTDLRQGEQLGGGLSSRPRARDGAGEEAQLAVAEQSDFDVAAAALEEGRTGEAVTLLDTFLATYPGGPLSSRASLMRGDALGTQGAWKEAARSYLDAFSGAPQDDGTAPTALFGLGTSLARIGNTSQACLTLDEVVERYPGTPEAARVPAERQALNCP